MKRSLIRQFRWPVLGTGLVLVTAAIIGMAASSEKRLLRSASRVADCADWETTPRSYEWLSDHELLFARMKGDNPSLMVRRDLQTGTETPLPKLTELMGYPEILPCLPIKSGCCGLMMKKEQWLRHWMEHNHCIGQRK